MGSLTPEKKEQILRYYREDPNPSRVAQKADVDKRTVRKVVAEDRSKRSVELLARGGAAYNNGKQKSYAAKAYQMFKKKVRKTDVAIKLDISASEVEEYYLDYLRMEGLDALEDTYDNLGKKGLESVAQHIQEMERCNMNPVEYVEHLREVPNLSNIRNKVEESREILASITDEIGKGKSELEGIHKQIHLSKRELQDTKDEKEVLEDLNRRLEDEIKKTDRKLSTKQKELAEADLLGKRKYEQLIEEKIRKLLKGSVMDYNYLILKATLDVLRDEEKYDHIKNLDLTNMQSLSDGDTKRYEEVMQAIWDKFFIYSIAITTGQLDDELRRFGGDAASTS